VCGIATSIWPMYLANCTMPPNLSVPIDTRWGSHIRGLVLRASWLGGLVVLGLETSKPTAV